MPRLTQRAITETSRAGTGGAGGRDGRGPHSLLEQHVQQFNRPRRVLGLSLRWSQRSELSGTRAGGQSWGWGL